MQDNRQIDIAVRQLLFVVKQSGRQFVRVKPIGSERLDR